YAPFPLGPAIIFYTIIDRRGPAWRWLACVVLVVGATISLATPGHPEPYTAIFQALIFVTAWAAGVLSRAKRASLQAAESRAERAEAELDRQTSRAAVAERTGSPASCTTSSRITSASWRAQARLPPRRRPAGPPRPRALWRSSAARPGRRSPSCAGCSASCAALRSSSRPPRRRRSRT